VAPREWLEIRAKDVDTAVAAAIEELGVSGPEAVEVEVVQEAERGFLGMGGQDAVVKVTVKPKDTRSRRGGRGRGRSKSNGSKGQQGSSGSGKRSGKPANEGSKSGGSKQRSNQKSSNGGRNKDRPKQQPKQQPKKEQQVEVEADRSEQAAMVQEFLTGLLGAFGVEGDVTTTVEDDIILANVTGGQTEALVGHKGAIMQAVLELSRTIVQRKSQAGARIRLDIAGYGERRREALRIYTGRLVEKILEEGGEIMLEPMNAADRKVVHDAAAEHDGVRTFSEGEEPKRSVVIAKDD
jgi:spoIIIJ-associated protein